MSRNLLPAFMTHPGVIQRTTAQRPRNWTHANISVPADIEYRVTFKDGTKSGWTPVSRGAMFMPPFADIIELRRKGADHVSG